ncbi:MAG TPA: DUF2254 domain-containing protein [Longimicrobiaceae bacterium]
MRGRLARTWEALRSSYWFVPALMALGAAVLAFGMVALDGRLGPEVMESLGWIYTGGPEGARGVLSTIAGSMITVAGVTFSVLVVALSLASSQFGPRVLGSFMRDPGNQFVLGAFVGIFLYCLLVLRTVRGAEDVGRFVPHLAVTVGVAMAVLGVGVLIYFVHHAAVSIQVSSVIAALAADLNAGVDRLFPEEAGDAGPAGHTSPAREPSCAVGASRDGHVQAIDFARLVEVARGRSAVLRLEPRIGAFVARGDTLAWIHPPDAAAEVGDDVRRALVLGSRRTPAQDVEFTVQQLVDVAVRALSPGINDPFTAAACVDRLGAALARVAERPDAPGVHRDGEGVVRVQADPVGFGLLAEAALSPIRQYAGGSTVVLLRLLDALARVARHTRGEGRRDVVRAHAARVLAAAERSLEDPADREAAAERFRAVDAALREAPVVHRRAASSGEGAA